MDYTELLPPLPDTEYLLGIPAQPYEDEWISRGEAWDESAMRDYALAAIAAAAPAIRKAERERCARVCDVTPPQPFRPSIEAAHAIRALPEEP